VPWVTISWWIFRSERGNLWFDILGEMQQWEVHCGKECLLIGECRLNGLWGTSSAFCWHPQILASQEQLALRGFNMSGTELIKQIDSKHRSLLGQIYLTKYTFVPHSLWSKECTANKQQWMT
jgi:hypothetical protein